MEQQIWKINLHCSMVHTSVKRLQFGSSPLTECVKLCQR
uniref:Uncharacterized protein n=1 Tax=Anguilla anguilla TaxID=7936 RepID=A0A0E9S772_ANGAN